MHVQPSSLPKLSGAATFIDTHCHLDMAAYQDDLDEVIASAARHGVPRILTIGIDVASSQKAIDLASRYAGVFATVGIHPHDAMQATPEALARLRLLAENDQVVGYGEIGLDYAKNYSPRKVQIQAFAQQLELAKEVALPVIIHDRDAHDDVLSLIRTVGPFPHRGVMHCFSGDLQLARNVLDLGFYLSIPGVATFANATTLREVIRMVDLDNLLLETDGPFLAPVPYRGKRNEPKYLLHTAHMVAELKNISLDELARTTTANATRLFNLPEVG
jgi:TatD DNase family protein